jgi:hypothetical protein
VFTANFRLLNAAIPSHEFGNGRGFGGGGRHHIAQVLFVTRSDGSEARPATRKATIFVRTLGLPIGIYAICA